MSYLIGLLLPPLLFGGSLYVAIVFLVVSRRLWRNRHVRFSEHDYQTGIAYDRRNNRIITTRRLKASALRKLLS